MRTLIVAVAVLAAVAVTAPAQAATRYASPNGGGAAPCTSQSNPCTLPGAASSAVAGDKLVVGSGTYQLTQILVLTGVNVEGARTMFSPRPRVLAPTDGTIAVVLHGGSVRNLAVEGSAGTNWVLDVQDTIVNSVVVKATGPQLGGIVLRGNSDLGDSTASTSGGGVETAVAAVDGTFHLRNVTAWSTGANSRGIVVRANSIPTDATVRNTIASGTAFDVEAFGTSSTKSADVHIDHSNFDTQQTTNGSVGGSSNQIASPVLVNPGAGDFRQFQASPTRDAGTGIDLTFDEGDGDLDGDRRGVGPGIDIGEDEWTPPPTVATGGATLIGATVATITASVNPNGGSTTQYFQWGLTAGYGNPSGFALLFAPISAGRGIDPVSVSRKLTGLTPSTTYHYRLRASNAGGTTFGPNAMFRTGAPGTPDPGGSGPEPGQPGGAILVLTAVSVKPARFRVAKGRTAISALRRRTVPRGTTFRYTLTEPATVKIAIKRKLAGRRKGGKCVRPTRALRRARRCTRLVAKGTLRRSSKLGANSVRFTGRIGRRKLAAGKFAAIVTAIDAAGNRSKPRTLAFTVVAG
jgi:hypothetical protein